MLVLEKNTIAFFQFIASGINDFKWIRKIVLLFWSFKENVFLKSFKTILLFILMN